VTGRHRRIDLLDDSCGMRLNDLAAVIEVDFVAVVGWRIVARRDVDARLRRALADSKAQFRGGARFGENQGITTGSGDNLGGKIRELA